MKQLQTRTHGMVFSYEGSIQEGVTIYFGKDNEHVIHVSKELLAEIITEFKGKHVKLGADSSPLRESLGGWLTTKIKGAKTASLLGHVLVDLDVAYWDRHWHIRFR